MKFQTREVLAGAYVSKKNPTYLTHLAEVNDNGTETRVMCSKVDIDHLVDSYGQDVTLKPTCPICARKWDRLQAKGELNICVENTYQKD
jgi:hypothetical protein